MTLMDIWMRAIQEAVKLMMVMMRTAVTDGHMSVESGNDSNSDGHECGWWQWQCESDGGSTLQRRVEGGRGRNRC